MRLRDRGKKKGSACMIQELKFCYVRVSYRIRRLNLKKVEEEQWKILKATIKKIQLNQKA